MKKNNMDKLFGTDGIRGISNVWPMTPDLILKIAQCAGHALVKKNNNRSNSSRRPVAVIGKDTRLSGYMFENLLTAGLISVGVDVFLLGPIPTPAVSMLVTSLRADFGIMISASHNPAEDNGIKFFNSNGNKISSNEQDIIQSLVEQNIMMASSERLGKAKRIDDAYGRYIQFVKNSFPKDLTLKGLKIVIDCANGAAYKIAPTVLWELGADVVSIACEPNGHNINKNCGATSLGMLQERVLKEGAHCGIALDGDADRIIMVDEKGEVACGDQLIALIATRFNELGMLKESSIVSTVMSNVGLDIYLKKQGISVHRSGVGDRLVLDMMNEKNINVGGEPSGHIILSDYVKSGDGLLCALQILAILKQKEVSFSEISNLFKPIPQVLKNISEVDRSILDDISFNKFIDDVKNDLIPNGQLLVRASGTEPIIRIMAQDSNEEKLEEVIQKISNFLNYNDFNLKKCNK